MLKHLIGKKTRSLNRLLRLIVITALLTSIAICNVSCNLGEKIGTNITEEIVEESLGEDVEVDIDGDKVNYSSEEGELSIDGEELTFEGDDGTVISSGTENEWPEGNAANYLPKLTSGVITYVMNSPEACMLMVEELTEEDYSQYLQKVKEAGFTENPTESDAEGLKIYSGSSNENVVTTISYVPEEKSIQITLDASMLQE